MGSTACVSFVICLSTVSSVVWIKLYKHFTYRLATYQVLSSMMFSVGIILQLIFTKYKKGTFARYMCEFVGFSIEYFMWVKLLFTICLILHFFFLAVFLKNLMKLELLYVFVSILTPIFFVWIPFIHHSYGMAGAWCWIRDWKDDCARKDYREGIIEQFLLWYGPLFLSLTVSIMVVVFILFVLVRRAYSTSKISTEAGPLLYTTVQSKIRHNRKALKQLLPLLAYPVIFYMLALLPLVNRIYDAISPNANYFLALGHCLSIGAWGFFSSWALLIHILLQKKMANKNIVYFDVKSSASTIQTGGFDDKLGLESSVKNEPITAPN